MANYIFLVQTNPDDIHAGLDAIHQVTQIAEQGHDIEQVFFYGPGVGYGHYFLSFPAGAPNLQQQWLELAKQYAFPLVVCATVGSQYGLEAELPPEGNLALGFQAGGLTDFMSHLVNADHLLQFPAVKQGQAGAKGHISFLFQEPATQPAARHGLDMLLMAASLELPCAAIYNKMALTQLVEPDQGPDLFKRLDMLADIFEFEGFYTTAEALQQAGLTADDLRVPVRMLTPEALDALLSTDSQHIVRF